MSLDGKERLISGGSPIVHHCDDTSMVCTSFVNRRSNLFYKLIKVMLFLFFYFGKFIILIIVLIINMHNVGLGIEKANV